MPLQGKDVRCSKYGIERTKTHVRLQPGDSQVYEFRAMQYGTGWYHSHYSLQCKYLPNISLYTPVLID